MGIRRYCLETFFVIIYNRTQISRKLKAKSLRVEFTINQSGIINRKVFGSPYFVEFESSQFINISELNKVLQNSNKFIVDTISICTYWGLA